MYTCHSAPVKQQDAAAANLPIATGQSVDQAVYTFLLKGIVMAPMPISSFKRPPEDNGRGVHWSASVYHPKGADLQSWINELKALQIKWVKVLDDSGGSSLELCRALLDNGIMPIVRLFRERPNPDHMGGRDIDAAQRLIKAGVLYLETNNEPDLPAEWRIPMPANWLDIVVDNYIYDADVILGAGGYPAVPAMGPGSQDNVVSRVVQRGRKDIFERGGWLAIHNYTLNHPYDYPYDAVNQAGKPLTVQEYEELKRWQYSHLTYEQIIALGIQLSREDYDKFQRWAWDGRTREQVNTLRAEKKNPGQTVFQDANCFRAWEHWGKQVFNSLGFYIPVISTEGGPVVGWGDDLRYAKMNPVTQAALQMEIMRFMQDEAPVWYFSCCTWLLASRPLGDFSPTWDQMSWYTHAWDLQFGLNGQLPLVQMLKSTPSRIRHEFRGKTSIVKGRVLDAGANPVPGAQLSLRQEVRVIAEGQSGADGGFKLEVTPGIYDLYANWVGIVAHSITLTEGDTDEIDVRGFDPVGAFTIRGHVRDAGGNARPGQAVTLRRNNIAHAVTTTDATGAFFFQPGVAGAYTVVAAESGADASVGPDHPEALADITLPESGAPRYTVTQKRLLPPDEAGNRNLFFGWVTNAQGQGLNSINMEMRWVNAEPGTVFPRTLTGQDRSRPNPDGYYEFLHTAGEFIVEVVQGDHPSDLADGLKTTGIPGYEGKPISYQIDFQLRSPIPPPANSIVAGSIPGGRVGQEVRLISSSKTLRFVLDASRSFRFDHVPAGIYDLVLAGIGLIAPDIVLDGANQHQVDLPVLGALVGQVRNLGANPRSVTLISETLGFTRRAQLTPENSYRFTNLPAGIYRLELGDAILTGLVLDGRTVVQAPVLDLAALSGGGTVAPQQSRLIGQIKDDTGAPLINTTITLTLAGQTIATANSTANGSFAFRGLGAGSYSIIALGQVLAADVRLNGQNTVNLPLKLMSAKQQEQLFSRYYLVQPANPSLRPALLRLIGPWLATQPAGVCGASVGEARKAATVVLIGDGISDATADALKSSGCTLIDHRLSLPDLAEMVRH